MLALEASYNRHALPSQLSPMSRPLYGSCRPAGLLPTTVRAEEDGGSRSQWLSNVHRHLLAPTLLRLPNSIAALENVCVCGGGGLITVTPVHVIIARCYSKGNLFKVPYEKNV